ncbi:MAG: hypothetical protein WBZ36_02940 [Candidatus Nitrosopolaris sp.]
MSTVPSRINEIEYQMERLKDPDYRAMLNKKSREYQREKRKDLEFRTKVAEQRRIRYKEKMNGYGNTIFLQLEGNAHLQDQILSSFLVISS